MTISTHGLIASFAGASLALAIAFAPIAPSAQTTTPNGAVTPPGTPGQFSNSPQTTNQQGGQASVTVDDGGHLRAVGRSTFAPKTTVRMMTHATPKPAKGTLRNGVYVAPRATLPPHP